MTCEICGSEFNNVNGYCPFCGASVKPAANQTEPNLQQPEQYTSSFPQQEAPGQLYNYQNATQGQCIYQQQGYGTVGQNTPNMPGIYPPSGLISGNYGGEEAKRKEGKSKKGLIIGIISGIVVLAGIFVLLLALGVFSSKNGSYHFQDAEEGVDILLVVDGEEGTLTVSVNGETKNNKVRISFEDDDVTIRSAEGKASAFYNTKNHTIILEKRILSEQGFFPVTNDGKYVFLKAEVSGMTLDADSMKSFGVDVSDFYIKIDGTKASINLMGNSGDCEVIIEGSTIKIIEPAGEEFFGTYDSDAKTITIEESNATMVFNKTEESYGLSGSYMLEKE